MVPVGNYAGAAVVAAPTASVNYPRRICEQITPEYAVVKTPQYWRRGSESNRRPRLCRPLHDHSATPPYARDQKQRRISKRAVPRNSGAGDESRTRDLNLGKVTLYQLSYSRESRRKFYGPFPLRSSRRRSPSARGATASFR